jgi:small ligand-binding sensory domain FIST
MRFASSISDAVNAQAAADAVCDQILEQLRGATCHVACVFASTIYRTSWSELVAQIHRRLTPRALIGCSGSGIIGGSQELEWVPALSVVAAHLPDVQVHPFVVTPEELEQSGPGGFWIDKMGAAPDAKPVFIVCVDPYTGQPEKLLRELNATYPHRPMIGGLVSGGNEAGEHVLLMGTDVYREGAVGVAMTGDIVMDTLIAQGCRPIGRPYIITKAEDNVVWGLGGRSSLEVLHQVLSNLSASDRELAQEGSIMVGLAIDEMRSRFASGDFLIRQIIGVDPHVGALAVAEEVQVGQTLQFHLRDAAASREELRRLLAQQQEGFGGSQPAGALLFNCSGRGKSFYGTSHYDVKTIRTFNGKVPVGGFFCNGEIGPVGMTNFLHGYTASIGFFRPLGAVLSRQTPQAAKDAA